MATSNGLTTAATYEANAFKQKYPHMPHDYNPEYLRRYLKYWNRDGNTLDVIDHEGVAWATEADRKERQKHFSIIAIYYYDLVAPLYEQGW